MVTTSEPWPGNGQQGLLLHRGDHLRAGHPGNPHHDAIYLGNGRVIHLCGVPGGGKAAANVHVDTLEMFASGRPVTVRPYADNHDPDAIIARATSKLGQGGYDLFRNNCQHFARWCATGDHISEQVTSVGATIGSIAAPAAAASVGINLVSSAGIVAGLSGPGIMSGLAACGALVGGGAVTGIVVLGAAPAFTSIAIMNHALREDEDLLRGERTARRVGRIGSAAGAVVGAAGSVTAVRALGVTGLSAAGISSGLAAIGATTVGRGMAAGTMCAIALPAIAAAVLGYLLYRVALWLTSDVKSGEANGTALA